MFLALILTLTPLVSRADDPAPTALETRAAVHAGFARLVFAAPAGGKPVPFTASTDGTTLTLQFQAPVKAALDHAGRALSTYLGDMALSADGKTLTAKLNRPVVPHQAGDGIATYYVDLIDQPKPKTIGDLAQEAQAAPAPAARAKPVPSVPVRAAVHDKADRLVFDWPKPVAVTTAEADGRGTIRFDQPGRFDIARLSKALPASLRPVRAEDDGGGLSLALPPGRHLKASRIDNRVAIDVLPPVAETAPPAAAVAAAPPPPVPRLRYHRLRRPLRRRLCRRPRSSRRPKQAIRPPK
ncbi:MAG: hypothetical protein WDN69_07185 [Aliidongia sp.]